MYDWSYNCEALRHYGLQIIIIIIIIITANMATVRKSEVIFEKRNLHGICTSLISLRNL